MTDVTRVSSPHVACPEQGHGPDAPVSKAQPVGLEVRGPEPVSLLRRLPGLPPEVARAKARVIDIATAARENWGAAKVESDLRPQIETLASWFAANRPLNEVELTLGTWRNEWLSNQDEIDVSFPGVRLDRSQVYQVVRTGYYYNVADLRVLGIPAFSTFLKGNYSIGNRPTPRNAGERGLNVIELEFDINMIRFGRIPRGENLVKIVEEADRRQTSRWDTFEVPGPRGVQGRLFNLFIDSELRVSQGSNLNDPEGGGLFVLTRADCAVAR